MPCERMLDGGLRLRMLHSEQDIERYAAFHGRYLNEHEQRTGDCLLRYFPSLGYDDAWLIEDSAGEVLATVCLIPLACRYGSRDANVELRVAMLEMVLSHPEHRGRGLVRALVEQFHRRVEEQRCDLGIISGIPYFYRQFGYGYAVDGEMAELLPMWLIPEGTPDRFVLRPAMASDIPQLAALYAAATHGLELCVLRDTAYWHYLLEAARQPFFVLEDRREHSVAGYATLQQMQGRLVLLESAASTVEAGLALLQLARQQALAELGPGELQVYWPEHGTLPRLARSFGSRRVRGWPWLLRIPDLPRLLTAITPVLEARLANSPWREWTGSLTVNTYRAAHRLCFADGRLSAVEPLGFVDSSLGADGGDLCIPPDALVRLVFGYRSLDELGDAWPDLLVKPTARDLVATLWPRMTSYLWTPYHYYLGTE